MVRIKTPCYHSMYLFFFVFSVVLYEVGFCFRKIYKFPLTLRFSFWKNRISMFLPPHACFFEFLSLVNKVSFQKKTDLDKLYIYIVQNRYLVPLPTPWPPLLRILKGAFSLVPSPDRFVWTGSTCRLTTNHSL